MRRRLVWNFEIIPDPPLNLPSPAHAVKGPRWELRYFWPEDSIISLTGLPDTLLELSRSQIKHREDTYCLLPHRAYNLKFRRGKLLYKPKLHQTNHVLAFGKKIDLAQHPAYELLPGLEPITASALLEQINAHSTQAQVTKEAIVCELTPTIQLELARLCVADTIYFSVSLESRATPQLEPIANHLLGNHTPCDYVTFLQQQGAIR